MSDWGWLLPAHSPQRYVWVTRTVCTLSQAQPTALWLTFRRPEQDVVGLLSGRLGEAACAAELAVSWALGFQGP